MRRRTFLKAFLSLSVPSWFARSTLAQQRPLQTGRRFIDVHCHFFNASDIPVRGFLQRVVFADYAFSQNASIAPIGVWRGMVAKLADYIVRRNAPNPQAELNCLRDPAQCSGFTLGAPRSASRSLRPQANDEKQGSREVLTEVLQSEKARSRSLSRSPSPNETASEQDVDAFVEFMRQEAVTARPGANGARSRSLQAPSDSRSIFETIADNIESGRSVFSRYFHWAGVLGDYRANIANTYFSLYDPQKTRLMLAVPALVDFSFWLQDQSPSSLTDQIELMALLSLRLPRPVHGFAPFDPLREVRRQPGETSSLQIVQNAVLNRGFLGAKIYSPMGFRPSGNAENGLLFPAYATMTDKNFGRSLDEALEKLYAWCEAEDVPILAHTTDSQAAGPEFASRAEPKFWAAVFSKYPKLRVNLSHFGNFSQAFQGTGDAASRFDKTWEREIGGFIKDGRFPNVYADISYFSWVLEGSSQPDTLKSAKVMFARFIKEFDPKVERLMFGTDWNMTGKAPGFERYLVNVEAFFRDVGLNETQLDNLFYLNAVRFLGLKGATKATARLNKFYRDNGKTMPAFS